MAKDDLKKGLASGQNVMHTIATGHTQDTKDTPKRGRPPQAEKPQYYRFNLAMPEEYRDYLKQASYNASSPGRIVTITEYICNLIKADMEANKWNQ